MNPETFAAVPSERALIGAILKEPVAVLPLCDAAGLSAESFTNPDARAAFAAVAALQAEGSPIDPAAVAQEIAGDAVSLETLARFMDDCVTVAHAEYHARQVREAERKAGLAAALRDSLQALQAGGSAADAVATVQAAGEAAEAQGVGRGKAQNYSMRGWGEILEMDLPPTEPFWGGFELGGDLGAVFGPPGLGKTRISQNIARNQVLGLPFAGMPTGTRPLRHALMGSESTLARWKKDATAQSAGLSAEQIALLNSHIRMATLENPEDAYISLASPVNVQRWRVTLEDWPPDVLWVDPWGDIVDGDACKDEDVRGTLATLRGLLRRVNPRALPIIVAHSRMGASNFMQATGYDAGNYGKNSKVPFAIARVVWNFAPGDETDRPPVLCFNEKNNNGPRLPPLALRLDGETMTYSPEPFDFDAWRAEVSNAAKGKGKATRTARLSEDAALEALGDNTGTAAEVRQTLRDKGASRDEADDLCKRLVTCGRWEGWRPKMKHTPTYIGPPEAMKRRKAEIADTMQKRMPI